MKPVTRWLTPAVCVLLLAFVVWRERGGTGPQTTTSQASAPEDVIYSMVDAGRNGDVDAWLGNYTGQLAASLTNSVNERGKTEFSKYLKDTHVPMKGIAISQNEAISESEARLKVEYVYVDRNELQTVYLRRSGGAWKIEKLDNSARLKTLVPYGTAVDARR